MLFYWLTESSMLVSDSVSFFSDSEISGMRTLSRETVVSAIVLSSNSFTLIWFLERSLDWGGTSKVSSFLVRKDLRIWSSMRTCLWLS